MYFREYGTVQNCAIVSNVAPVGAGVHFYYGGLVQDCTISHNLAATTNYQPAGNFFYGGGVHCWCGGTVQNCTITDNAVSSSNCSPYYTYYCYGGGVHVEKEGLIQNCTIISNSVFGKNTAHGGGVYLHEGGTLQNSVVYGNSATALALHMRPRPAAACIATWGGQCRIVPLPGTRCLVTMPTLVAVFTVSAAAPCETLYAISIMEKIFTMTIPAQHIRIVVPRLRSRAPAILPATPGFLT